MAATLNRDSSPTRRLGNRRNENTPLLGTIQNNDAPDIDNGQKLNSPVALAEKPLPMMQMFLLCYARMMEPIAFFSIFPYIAQMVKHNGDLPASNVGFYSGLIECIFSAAQMAVLILWGYLADRLGRRPILIYTLFGTVIGPALFGVSQTIPQMIIFRTIAGVFSGSSLIIRTMIADHATVETQARAFSWFAFAGNVGIFLGPLIGGALADPVTQYPQLFKGVVFFEKYPYALPGFAVAALSMTAAISCILFLEESLEKECDTSERRSDAHEILEKPSLWSLVQAPGVAASLFVYEHLMLLASCYTALVPVALFTPIALGGIGRSSIEISIFFAAQGGAQALWLLLVFPLLQRRIGTKGVLRICAFAYPFLFIGYMFMNILLRDGSQVAVSWFWILGSVVCLVGPGVAMAFSAAQLSINDSAPSRDVVGVLNAIAMTCSSGIKSIAPGIATSLYAVGVRDQILWGHLAWFFTIPVSIVLSVVLRWLPEDEKRRRAR